MSNPGPKIVDTATTGANLLSAFDVRHQLVNRNSEAEPVNTDAFRVALLDLLQSPLDLRTIHDGTCQLHSETSKRAQEPTALVLT